MRSAGAGASASSFTRGGVPDDVDLDVYTLAWYCVQLILDTIKELSPQSQNSKRKEVAEHDVKPTDRVHRLHLMLISTISSLPLPLMLRALEETRRLITIYPADDDDDDDNDRVGTATSEEGSGKPGGKLELLEALFNELLEKTGDREKETAMRWWYKYRPELISGSLKGSTKGAADKDKGKGASFLSWFSNRKAGETGTGLHEQQREPRDATVEDALPNVILSRL